MTARHIIFVYGSLRKGKPQHALLSDARFLGEAMTRPVFTLVDTGAWPAATLTGQTAIAGEVYAVSAKRLAALDAYEQHPFLFRRSRVVLADNREAWMWVYISEINPHWRLLESGYW